MTSGTPAKAELCNGAVCYNILFQYHYHITITLSACRLLHADDDDVYDVPMACGLAGAQIVPSNDMMAVLTIGQHYLLRMHRKTVVYALHTR